MKKRIVAVFLIILLMLPMGAMQANAGALDILSGAGSVSSIIGAGISILQVAGVFKDETTEQLEKVNKKLDEIKTQLNGVNEKLDKMSSKLNEMSNRLSNIEKQLDDIKDDLNEVKKEQVWDGMYSLISLRNDTAGQMKSSWRDFVTNYKEPMDRYLAQYTSMVTSGIAYWCEHPEKRDEDAIKNSCITVIFKEENGELAQQHSYQNDLPSDDSGLKYVYLDSSLLPKEFMFEADTYQDTIINTIKKSILNGAKNGRNFKTLGFTEFSPQELPNMTDEFAEFIAKAAFNELVYRVACVEVNAKANDPFISNVKSAFDEYMKHLFLQEEGLDAFIQAQYMTHTFEYELKGTITDFCDSMACLTTVYGLLVSDITALSRLTPNKQKTVSDFITNLSNNIDKIELIGKQSYTGYDNYCYITNTLIHLGKINLNHKSENLKFVTGVSDFHNSLKETTQEIPGKEFDEGSKKVKSSAALLMLKCTQNSGSDFAALLKDTGAWDYDDLQDSLNDGNILLENGEDSKFDKTENLTYVVYDSAQNTVLEDRMTYAQAKVGTYPMVIDNYALKGDYLDTFKGDVEIDGNVAGFMLINFEDKKNPLRLCTTPNLFNQTYKFKKTINVATITASVSVPYLYQTELPSDALGELSPLRHINNLYLSSIYSSGNLWLIIILVGIAVVIAAAIVIVVLVEKKKSKKKDGKDTADDNPDDTPPTEPEQNE